MVVRITSWNVNGIRNPFSYQPWRDKRSFVDMFDILEADIIVLQETKIQRKDLRDDMVLVPGWDCYFSFPKHEKGNKECYYQTHLTCNDEGKFGVVVYTRQSVCAPIKAEEGITGVLCPPNSSTSFKDLPENQQIGGYPTSTQALAAPEVSEMATEFSILDSEGRCVILEFPAFVLIGVYNPATRDETRIAFRIAFLNLLDIRIRNLIAMGKRVILTGDLNITKSELDVANCEADLRKAGTTVEEYFSRPPRRMLNHLVDDGIVWGSRDKGRETAILHDLCRAYHLTRKGMFTCWETKINARPGNYGSRIDYVLCSLDMKDWFVQADIQEGLMGSDHCPVFATLREVVEIEGKQVHIHDLLNPPGMFEKGERVREHTSKDLQPISGKLLPEFCGRRSIKDMFKTSGTLAKPTPTESNKRITLASASPQKLTLIETNTIPDTEIKLGLPVEKRHISESSHKKSPKRQKYLQATSSTRILKNQQTLSTFFSTQARPRKTLGPDKDNGDVLLANTQNDTTTLSSGNGQKLSFKDIAESTHEPKLQRAASQEGETIYTQDLHGNKDNITSRQIADPVKSRESWSKIFARPAVPLCEGHNEACKIMTTKKAGTNCGRSFWICSKPLGPSGQKEKGTEWRCGTFIWCSDWNSVFGLAINATDKDGYQATLFLKS